MHGQARTGEKKMLRSTQPTALRPLASVIRAGSIKNTPTVIQRAARVKIRKNHHFPPDTPFKLPFPAPRQLPRM